KDAQKYSDDQIGFVNMVYMSNQNYSAIINQPQQYLIMISNEDKSWLLSYIASPNEVNEYEYEVLYSFEEAHNVKEVQLLLQKLLVVFNTAKK
ncbi:MAG: hypothetical protein ACRCTA_03280, partial [Bacilli bacterium]